MISPNRASTILGKYKCPVNKERIGINVALNRLLAEEIKSKVDFPSFEQVNSNGIALYFNSYKKGWRDYKIEGVQRPRSPRLSLKDKRNCIEVTRGSMLPIGCDSVVPTSDISISYANKIAKVRTENIRAGQNINTKGSCIKKGTSLLFSGARLTALDISLMATLERSEIDVFLGPITSVISVGNEFVDINVNAQPHQIRLSASYALQAALKSLHCECSQFHFLNNPNTLDQQLSEVFSNNDVVIIIGDTAKEKSNCILDIFNQHGVHTLFDGIEQSPKCEMFFGFKNNTFIFFLPSPPTIALLCYYKYIVPWILKSMNNVASSPLAILNQDISFQTDKVSYLRVRLKKEGGKLIANEISEFDFVDFGHLKPVEGFLEIPPTNEGIVAGSAYPLIPFGAIKH